MSPNQQWTAESVGPGWTKLVQPLIDLCTLYNIQILQIKEKFGGLRFYHQADHRIDSIVEAAEAAAAHTCEECGEDGVLEWGKAGMRPKYKATTGTISPKHFWLKTLCELCRTKLAESL